MNHRVSWKNSFDFFVGELFYCPNILLKATEREIHRPYWEEHYFLETKYFSLVVQILRGPYQNTPRAD